MSASEPRPRPPAGAPAPSDGTRSGPSGAAAGTTASAGARTPPPAPGSGPAPGELDPITLEVVCEGLIAIVREMRATIIRSSFSSVIYEFDDFSCALFGPGGEMVAQSWDHPGHVLPLPWGVRCMFEDFNDDLHPGDVVLLNDPYRGGTHLNDVTLIHPIFDEDGNILVFPAVRAHWVDVGGMVPGSYSGLSTNIYQEGVRIPPIKILERGKVNRAAMALLMANMRVPEEREGDFNASLGACRVAERRIHRIYERYGTDTVHAAIRINLDRTERRLRERIAELPDGSYCYEDYLEYYEEGRLDPVLVRIELTVDGDGIVADFAGSNPQVPGVVNSSLAVTGAGVFVAVKSTLDPGGAVNDGAFRPIELRAWAAVRLLRGAGRGERGFRGGGRVERVRQRRLRQHPHHPDRGIDRERDAAPGGAVRASDRFGRRWRAAGRARPAPGDPGAGRGGELLGAERPRRNPAVRGRRGHELALLPKEPHSSHFVNKEFEAYLKCGRLKYGFLGVKCDACRHGSGQRRVCRACRYPPSSTIAKLPSHTD